MTTLPTGARVIDVDDIVALGNVDDALAGFYASEVRAVADGTGVPERIVRAWFDERLINEQGFRTQVLEGPGSDGAAVLRGLEDAHLIRADSRRGAEWYELAHDRLIEPVRADNAAWRQANLSTLQREASVWDRQSRPAGLLMGGDALAEAAAWAASHPEELSDVDRAYLDACQEHERRLQTIQAASVRNRRLARLSAALAALALIALVWSVVLWRSDSAARSDLEIALKDASEAKETAEAAERSAEKQSQSAEIARVEAVAAGEQATRARNVAQDELERREQADEARDAALDDLAQVLLSTTELTRSFQEQVQLLTDGVASGPPELRVEIRPEPDPSCASSSSARSLLDGERMGELYVTNGSGGGIVMLWLSPSGNPVQWATMDDGIELDFSVLEGWSFMFTDEAGNCLMVL